MIHIQVKTSDKSIDSLMWLVGSKDYYIYDPFAETLRMLADWSESRWYRKSSDIDLAQIRERIE